MRISSCVALAVTFALGCSKPSSAPTPDAAPSEADDEVHPVYGPLEGPPDPLAVRLCAALHDVPETRRAACCHERPGVVLTGECSRTLTLALASRAVTLASNDVDRCAAALDAQYTGCDWAGPFAPPLPAACADIVHGTLPAGARCRSSLECAGALRCAGAGPTRTGQCASPRQDGEACGRSADALAANIRAADVDTTHPECAGFCNRFACAPRVDASTTIKSRLPTGAPCTTDFECTGGCVKAPSAARGTCGMKCGVR